VRGASAATLLVTSFAVSYLLRNIAAVAFGSTPKSLDIAPGLAGGVDVAGVFLGKIDLVTIATTVALVVLLHLFLTRTALGIQMRAAAENFRMARLLGVSANRVIATAFAISGALAAIASFLLIVQIGSTWPTLGSTPVLYAFVATVIGGMGSLVGAVLGGYLLGIVTVAAQVLLPYNAQSWRDAVVFGVVLGVLIFRPQGLVVVRSSVSRV
jgi:branched-chain amino acid transport system permease protein